MNNHAPEKPELLCQEVIPNMGVDMGAGVESPNVLEEKVSEGKRKVQVTSFNLLGKPLFTTLREGVIEDSTHGTISLEEIDYRRTLEAANAARHYRLILLVIILLFVSAITVFLVMTDKTLYERVLDKLLPFLLGLAGGLGGGYGLRLYKEQSKDSKS